MELSDPPCEHARIGAYVIVTTPIEPADLCFVFGTRHGTDSFAHAIAYYFHEGYYARIIVAGGSTADRALPESDEMKSLLEAHGVPGANILCERSSTNTMENVVNALPVIDSEVGLEKISSLIAVGKVSSSRRYLMTLKRHWSNPRKMFLPINYYGVPTKYWWKSNAFRTRVLKEWEKIPTYLERGHLSELDESDGLLRDAPNE